MTSSEVTVLVPLHRSGPWSDVVEANLRRLAPGCRIIVSDASGADDSLARLRARLRGHHSIEWVVPRPLAPGWIAHYNDLRARVSTPLFMWLPHDDEIDPDYLERCRRALVREPGAVGAFGPIRSIEGPGLTTVENGGLPTSSNSRFRFRANRLLFEWNPGVAFRSIFRTASSTPIRPTNEASEWADIVWIYGLSLGGSLVEVPHAEYRKRFYEQSTHASWRRELHPHALVHLTAEILVRPHLNERNEILRELLEGSVSFTERRLDEIEDRLTIVHHELAATEIRTEAAEARASRAEQLASELVDARGHLAAEIEAYARSGSWRLGRLLTAPLRALRRLVGRVRASGGFYDRAHGADRRGDG